MTSKELRDTVYEVDYRKVVDSLFLNDRQRAMMEMRYIKGLLYKEIASEFNCSEQCIKKEFSRINSKLAKLDISTL